MLDVRFDYDQIKRLEKALGDPKRLHKEMAVAVNATARAVSSGMAKDIGSELATTQKTIKSQLKVMKKAQANKAGLNATVRLQYSSRIPLREFGARQTAKGTSYKVSKKKGRRMARSAFQGPRPGAVLVMWKGRVFKRETKKRLPIRQLWGPSIWGVFVINKFGKKTKKDASAELKKQMERRIHFINFKKQNNL